MKMNTHDLYEDIRADTTSKKRRRELEREMREHGNRVPVPEGVQDL